MTEIRIFVRTTMRKHLLLEVIFFVIYASACNVNAIDVQEKPSISMTPAGLKSFLGLNSETPYEAFYLIEDESGRKNIAPTTFSSPKIPYLLPRSMMSAPAGGDPKNAILSENKIAAFPSDSAVYYVRMPTLATSYLYATDFGDYQGSPYSFPSFIAAAGPPPPHSSHIHLPLPFVANGKPTYVHTIPMTPQNSGTQPAMQTPTKPKLKPKPAENSNSDVINVNKTPYLFNGKANAIYLLQHPYNPLYANSVNNFYP